MKLETVETRLPQARTGSTKLKASQVYPKRYAKKVCSEHTLFKETPRLQLANATAQHTTVQEKNKFLLQAALKDTVWNMEKSGKLKKVRGLDSSLEFARVAG